MLVDKVISELQAYGQNTYYRPVWRLDDIDYNMEFPCCLVKWQSSGGMEVRAGQAVETGEVQLLFVETCDFEVIPDDVLAVIDACRLRAVGFIDYLLRHRENVNIIGVNSTQNVYNDQTVYGVNVAGFLLRLKVEDTAGTVLCPASPL